MQEEVESKAIALSINTAKLTGRIFKAAISKYLAHCKEKRRERKNETHSADLTPHGKQSVRDIIGQNQGVSTIESTDKSIRSFDRIARKYGVDYAVKKVRNGKAVKYVIFFKARDADAITSAFTDYSRKSIVKEKRKSVLTRLRELAELVRKTVIERSKNRSLER